MLRAGGADVTLAGFRRDDNPLARVEGLVPIELGVTSDGRFGQRIRAVAEAALSLRRRLSGIPVPDVIVGRNLEMLALARRASFAFDGAPVVYECLDIHRLLLRGGITGHVLRAAERFLCRDARLLVTSSPAFIENYFRRFRQIDLPIELLENKVLALGSGCAARASSPPPGPPWRIGWFGALRCNISLDLLSRFSRLTDGRFEVVLRGRPAHSQFRDFDRHVAAEPFVAFHGPYRNPEELPDIYGEVHFAWLGDFYEAGQNSDWLLPNRLYESCRHGAVPIAVAGTETARFLAGRGIGLVLDDPSPEGLAGVLADIDPARYAQLANAVTSVEQAAWACDASDCHAFVARLGEVAARRPASPGMPRSATAPMRMQ